ncbi:MAG: DUF389 domain-containing protein [Sphingobacteriales bacterium]|nr:MAG: DUF389 domain-containing protein [Sphingobacteriales bacterium]
MHRTLEAVIHPDVTQPILNALKGHPEVMGLSVFRAASVKPAGADVLHIQALNKGTDAILSIIQQESGAHSFSIATAEIATLIDPEHQKAIEADVDEAMWEEIETGLRHNGRITPNFLLLMAIGGILAATGFVADDQLQVIVFIAAAIIAPGLEPLAKIPLGIVLKKRACLTFGLRSSLVGYTVVLLGAIASFGVLQLTGDGTAAQFLEDGFTKSMQETLPKDWIISTAAASASIIMYLSYRRNVIAGPLIALVAIPATAAIGIALMIGEFEIAGRLAGRLGTEVAVTISVGILFIWAKQKWVHKRKPLV